MLSSCIHSLWQELSQVLELQLGLKQTNVPAFMGLAARWGGIQSNKEVNYLVCQVLVTGMEKNNTVKSDGQYEGGSLY